MMWETCVVLINSGNTYSSITLNTQGTWLCKTCSYLFYNYDLNTYPSTYEMKEIEDERHWLQRYTLRKNFLIDKTNYNVTILN